MTTRRGGSSDKQQKHV